jgi:hypothetical protein
LAIKESAEEKNTTVFGHTPNIRVIKYTLKITLIMLYLDK